MQPWEFGTCCHKAKRDKKETKYVPGRRRFDSKKEGDKPGEGPPRYCIVHFIFGIFKSITRKPPVPTMMSECWQKARYPVVVSHLALWSPPAESNVSAQIDLCSALTTRSVFRPVVFLSPQSSSVFSTWYGDGTATEASSRIDQRCVCP